MRLVTADKSQIELIMKTEAAISTHYTERTKHEILEWFDEKESEVTLAYLNGIEDPIGFVAYRKPFAAENRDDEMTVYIDRFGIHPDHRRQRHGTNLYYQLAQKWFLQGVTYLYTDVAKMHRDDCAFWESLDFLCKHRNAVDEWDFWCYDKSLIGED